VDFSTLQTLLQVNDASLSVALSNFGDCGLATVLGLLLQSDTFSLDGATASVDDQAETITLKGTVDLFELSATLTATIGVPDGKLSLDLAAAFSGNDTVSLSTFFTTLNGTAPPGLPGIAFQSLSVQAPAGSGTYQVTGILAAVNPPFNLAAIPLVGALPDADALQVSQLGLELTSALEANFVIGLALGTTATAELLIPLSGSPGMTEAGTGRIEDAVGDGSPGFPASGQGVTIPIQRTFGPLSISSLTASLNADGLEIGIDATLALSGLTVEVQGLGATIDLPSLHLSFDIEALEVSYESSALTIDGVLVAGEENGVKTFDGELTVNTPSWSLGAIASFAETSPPSLMSFAVVDIPLGGPPFFFVTGISGGFGLNRALGLPALDEIDSYPLVEAAEPGSGTFGNPPSLTAFESAMATYFSPSTGENWLAAGVQFTSFEIVKGSILLTAAFGVDFQVGVLGTASLSLPTGQDASEDPAVLAQVVLEATYASSTNALLVAGELAPPSYIFDPACRLTGGFALSVWFGGSAHPGDFVMTLGGYNPNFQAPSWYPQIPRLGFNWSVDGAPLVIQGTQYTALVPHCLMMGAELQAVWQSGSVRATFTAFADFLIGWAPFFYQADAGVNFAVHAVLNLDIVTVTVNLSVGADLTLEGPPFGGTASINLSVISFTIDFGAPAQKPKLQWTDFKTAFLPQPPAASSAVAQAVIEADTGTPSDNPVINLQITAGQRATATDSSGNAVIIVDPETLAIGVTLLIPASSITLGSQTTTSRTPIDIGPLSISGVSSAVTLTAVAVAEAGTAPALTLNAPAGTAPVALWSVVPNLNQALNEPSLLSGVLIGATLNPSAGGGATPASTNPAPLSNLNSTQEAALAANWGPVPTIAPDTWGAITDVVGEMAGTIDATDTDTARADIVQDLLANGFPVSDPVNVVPLTTASTCELPNIFMLRSLGEQKAA
jgi:hypothetical protein